MDKTQAAPAFDFDIDLSAIEEAMRSACHGGPSLKGRDLLRLAELSPDEFDLVLNTAAGRKEDEGVVAPDRVMQGDVAAVLMAGPAWPQRTAVEAAVTRLGGSCLIIPEGAAVLEGEDAAQDAAQMLDLCSACIVAGGAEVPQLEELAEWAQAPVLNAGGPGAQPLQALADAMTLAENLGGLEGAPLAFLGSAASPLACSYLAMAALAGASLSLLVMTLLRRRQGFSIMGISIAGGVSHNIGQLLVAMLIVENTSLMYYAPALLVSGVVTGFLIGILTSETIKRIP